MGSGKFAPPFNGGVIGISYCFYGADRGGFAV